jgi:hypothetical protein
MRGSELDFWRKVKLSFYATLVFLLITNPITYRFTQAIFQGVEGYGLYLIQGLLFFCVVFSIMLLASNT